MARDVFIERRRMGGPVTARPGATRGVCPVCGDTFTITREGVLRKHVDHTQPMEHGLPWHPQCEGAGGPPVDVEKG